MERIYKNINLIKKFEYIYIHQYKYHIHIKELKALDKIINYWVKKF